MAYGDDRLVQRLQRGIWPIIFSIGLLLLLLALAVFQLASFRPENAVGPALVALFPAFNLLNAFKSFRVSKTQN